MGGGHQLSEAGGGTKTQRIAMKFGVLVIGLGENHMSIDELAQTKKNVFLGHPSGHGTPLRLGSAAGEAVSGGGGRGRCPA